MRQDRILVADDDPAVRRTVCRILESDGMETEQAASGEETIEKIKRSRYDLIVLDIMMGEVSGFDVIKAIRETDSNMPVIVLSGKTQDNDMVFALAIGADDYITKPFSPYFLCAKVKASLRRRQSSGSYELNAPPFRYLYREMRLFKHDEEIPLSAKESMMMRYFMENSGNVCTKDAIALNVWDSEIVDSNTIMVSISNLRKKIEQNPEQPVYLKTVRGVGYRFST